MTGLVLRMERADGEDRGLDVTVIIPAFNRRRWIGDALESVRGAVSNVLSSQIIVVDDASTDDTVQVARSHGFAVQVIERRSNGGQCAARNDGLDESRGEFLKYLDSDDVLEPGSLVREVRAARETGADIVVAGHGWFQMTAAGGEVPGTRRSLEAPQFESIPDGLVRGDAVPTSAALYRRTSVGALRWDERLRKLDDWDYFIRAALASRRIVAAQGVAYWARGHAAQVTRASTGLRHSQEVVDILAMLEEALRSRGELNEARRLRMAQYYYKELRVLCLRDEGTFSRVVEHVRGLDRGFAPVEEERQRWFRWLARTIGFERAVRLHSRVKRALRRERTTAAADPGQMDWRSSWLRG